MKDDATYYLPKYLDEPPRWLFWTLDEALALLAPIVVGLIFFDRMVLGFGIGVLCMGSIKKIKGSEGHDFLLGFVYWHFPLGERFFKATPPSHHREYVG